MKETGCYVRPGKSVKFEFGHRHPLIPGVESPHAQKNEFSYSLYFKILISFIIRCEFRLAGN